MTRAEQITAQALKLPKKSRNQIINDLLKSMDGDDDPAAAVLWEKEIARRVKMDDQGKLKYISMQASLADLRKHASH